MADLSDSRLGCGSRDEKDCQMPKPLQGARYLLNLLRFLYVFAFPLQHLLNVMKPMANVLYLPPHDT